MQIVTHVLTSPQTLDDARQKIARQNIGAVAGIKTEAGRPIEPDSDGYVPIPEVVDADEDTKGIVMLTDDPTSDAEHTAASPAAIRAALADFGGLKVVPLDPKTEEPDVPLEERSNKYIYLTEDPSAQGDDHYKEWIWDLGDPSADPPVAASWKLIGTTSPDLRDYVHKVSGGTSGNLATLTDDGSIEDSSIAGTDVADAVAKKHSHSNQDTLDDITAAYTTAEQTKLTGIAEGAQVNVIEHIIAGDTELSPDNKTVTITLATDETDGLLPSGMIGGITTAAEKSRIPSAPVSGADRIYSYDDTNGTSWQQIVKEYVGNMILDQQGTPVTDEKGDIMYEEEAVPLWLSYKGVEFGARRAYDDHTGANIHDSIEARTTMAQVTTAIETALAKYGGFVVVNSLVDGHPDVADPSGRFIYLYKDPQSSADDPYTEWIYTASGTWDKIGTTSIDVSNFTHKVANANGNLPKLNSDGDLEDSGIAASDVATSVQNSHTHSNKAVLDATTASYTTEEQTKLNGIESGAEVNLIESVSVAGTTLEIESKSVNVPEAGGTAGAWVKGVVSGEDTARWDSWEQASIVIPSPVKQYLGIAYLGYTEGITIIPSHVIVEDYRRFNDYPDLKSFDWKYQCNGWDDVTITSTPEILDLWKNNHDFTIETLFNTNGSNEWIGIGWGTPGYSGGGLLYSNPYWNTPFMISFAPGKVYIFRNGSRVQTLSTSVSSGSAWHHVAITYTATTGVCTIYMDGNSIGTYTITGTHETCSNFTGSFGECVTQFAVYDYVAYTENFSVPTIPHIYNSEYALKQ